MSALEKETIYRARLDEMFVILTEELKGLGIHNPQNPSDWIAVPEGVDAEEPDPNLSADVVESWNERASLVATLEKKYNEILKARDRLATHTFGVCEVCGNEIEEKRLDANPVSRTCIAHLEDEGRLP
jgi:RNA polymerase-binding transcription factor DksA